MAAVDHSQGSTALVSDSTAVKSLSPESLAKGSSEQTPSTSSCHDAHPHDAGFSPLWNMARFLAAAKSDGSVRDPSARTMMHCEGN